MPVGGIIKSRDEFGSSFVISWLMDLTPIFSNCWFNLVPMITFSKLHINGKRWVKWQYGDFDDMLMICLLVNLQVFLRHQADFASHLGICNGKFCFGNDPPPQTFPKNHPFWQGKTFDNCITINYDEFNLQRFTLITVRCSHLFFSETTDVITYKAGR